MGKMERSKLPPRIMQELWSKKLEYSPEEERELADLQPARELWPFPEPLPPGIDAEMPGEEEVAIIFAEYMGANPPEGWTEEKARAMVNVGRKRMWRLWNERGE
jgi:hypothetical protein